MKDARSALAPELLNRRVLAEQVALMCRLTTSPLFASVLFGGILAYLVTAESGIKASVTWYVALLIVLLMRWRVARAYLRHPWPHEQVRRWRLVMIALAALGGSVWSIPGSLMLPTDPVREIIMSVLFVGATASGHGSQSPVRHAYAALLIPFVTPYIITQLLMGGDRVWVSMAFMIYVPVMLVIANRNTRSVERQIRLAIENEALADELRHERDRANEANRELQIQIEQHRRSSEQIRMLNHDLELQAAELRTANSDLEGFSYSVSHDLRAPLRAIDGFSRLLQDADAAEDAVQARHYLSRIRANVSRMSMLIDDLLAFSRCGRQPVDMSEVRMDELARMAVNEARSTNAGQSPPQIVIEALPPARGDQRLLLQVWINLIDNAVKYSSKVPEPKISVRGREEANRVVYEVVDNGVGFDSSHASTLFGVFQRLHGAGEYPGTGVGLAIVKRIVARHGGEVWARSEVNQGATFGFALPRPRSQQSERIPTAAAG